jgi:hypothetical protein
MEGISIFLNMAKDTIKEDKWLLTSIFELGIIGFLAAKLLRKRKTNNIQLNPEINSAKEANIDMDNLIMSINKSGELYNRLIRICHPDRFTNSDKQEIANEIFKEISKNRRNYKTLLELQERAVKELNIQTH